MTTSLNQQTHDADMHRRDTLVRQAEVAISNALRGGVLLSAAVIVLGLLLLVLRGKTAMTYPHSLPAIVQSVAQGNPRGIIVAGLVMLLFTPVLRVGISIIAFALEGDKPYVAITTLVFVILLASIVVLGALFGVQTKTDTLGTSGGTFALIFCAALLAGLIGALVGLGGGIFIVPLLTLAFGLPIEVAIGASIVSVIATSSAAAAAYVRDHMTNLRIGMFLEIATTIGAVSGAFLAIIVAPKSLFIVFGLVLLFSAVPLIRKIGEEMPEGVKNDHWAERLRLSSSYPDVTQGKDVPYAVTHVPVGFGMMYIAGLISGLLGIGSGTFKVLAMDTAMRLPMKVSSTTSNFMIGVTAAASAGIYFQRGDIHPLIAAPVALGVLIGAFGGAKLLEKLSNRTVRKIFVPILLAIAVEMLVRGIF